MTGIRLASRRAAARARLSLILLALVALACLLATLPLSLLSGQLGYGAVAVVIGIPCAAVGVVVARRQPGNPLGWLFLMTGILLLISNDAGDYAYYVYRLGHRLSFGPAALVIDQLWEAGLVLFVVIILLFPDGRLPSAFWRWALRVFCALYLGLLAAVATHPQRRASSAEISRSDSAARCNAGVPAARPSMVSSASPSSSRSSGRGGSGGGGRDRAAREISPTMRPPTRPPAMTAPAQAIR